MTKVLIVGGGHAGANTAFALRKDGFDGEIAIISDEGYLPYHRPPLSKDFLKHNLACLLYTSPSPRDRQKSRMPSSA